MKSFKCFFILITFISLKVNSFAQGEEWNYLGGSFGGSDFHIKDDHASPLIFSSIGIAPSLQYFHIGKQSRHYFESSYFYDYLSTSADNFQTDNHRFRIRYNYLHSIADLKLFDLFIGGSAASYLCHSDYYYQWLEPGSAARSMESWYWSNSIDLSTGLEYQPAEREFLSVQIFIPIVSNVSRPKFSPSGDFNYIDNDLKFKMFGETKFFPENFSVNAIVTYQHPLIWNFNYQISYEFYYSFYDKPKEVDMYMNILRAGLFFCF